MHLPIPVLIWVCLWVLWVGVGALWLSRRIGERLDD